MRIIFNKKTVDEELAILGFEKKNETLGCTTYERKMPLDSVQVVALIRNTNGSLTLNCYEKASRYFIGLSYRETELFMKKMKQLGLNKL